MSKMDNLRAMREARYEESQARAKAGRGSATPKPQVAAKAPAAGQAERTPTLAVVPDPPEPEQELQEVLCGHRNMSGRTCTREAGHSAKSHRYS
jgi:hypothetical protein